MNQLDGSRDLVAEGMRALRALAIAGIRAQLELARSKSS